MSVIETLAIRASQTPDALAYSVRGERLTWRSVFDGARRAASVLAAHGLAPGSLCAIALSTNADFIHSFFGAQMLGGVPVAINPRLPLAQLRRRVEDLGGALTIIPATTAHDTTPPELDGLTTLAASTLREGSTLSATAIRQTRSTDLSHLQLTSGTSGASKAAMISYGNVAASLEGTHELLRPVADDVLVGWLPLHHDLGLMRFLFFPVAAGLPCHLLEPSMAALPTWLRTISAMRGTITAAPDFAYRLVTRLVDPSTVQLSSLRVATSGGEPVRLTSIRLFEQRFGLPGVVQPGYGLAETTLAASAMGPGEALRVDESGHVSCGRPEINVTIRIVDASGASQPPNRVGRILVHGPVVFQGYWQDREQTAEVINDGWLNTGDDGKMDEEGYLYVLGRSRALIKRAGATIAPREIEELVDGIDGVRRSAAVGLAPDEHASTEEVAVVVEVERRLGDSDRRILVETISQRVRAALGFAPHEINLVAPGTIPRTPTGKIQYGELKRILGDAKPPER